MPPRKRAQPAKSLEATLWDAADELRGKMDSAQYKHVVLGLIFLKYVSDTFMVRHRELARLVDDPESDYFMPNDAAKRSVLEDRDEYTAEGVFWIPEGHRWDDLRKAAKQPDIGKRVDDAMEAIERENPTLKGVLPKNYTQRELSPENIGGLIDTFSRQDLAAEEYKGLDVLGRVYEYFLGQFASNEGKKAGEFYTPRSVVELLVEMLQPYHGRVLDPACGSGNFLYLSLLALKDIEHFTNLEAEAISPSLAAQFPTSGPENVLGIELNPYAAELARVSIWIGEIQWMRRNGFEAAKNPILRSLGNIENRDAIVTFNDERGEWEEACWPTANVIVGNPPFLGGKSMRRTLGEAPTAVIRRVYVGRLAAFSDLVCYWFEKARALMESGAIERGGFVATKAIAKNANLPVLVRLSEAATIYNAWQNEPWVVDGASVRVSLVCFARKGQALEELNLNGAQVGHINPNLTTGLDTTKVARLEENAGSVFIGIQLSGPFLVDRDLALDWLRAPVNPNGQPNSSVLSAYVATEDVVGRPSGEFMIDFPTGLSESEASLFELPFEHLRTSEYDPHRDGELVNFAAYRTDTESQNSSWWEPHRARPPLRSELQRIERYLVTAETTEHRVFRFLPAETVPDKSLYAFPGLGFVGFGVLQSRIHEEWCTYFGNRIGAGNQRRYNASYVYLTFAFPEGLTPDIPAADYVDDPRAQAIAAAAERLNELRENWLNPADLVQRVPEVVEGYPDRILPKDDAAAKELKKRTLTNLYNARPAWLDHAHRTLDEAVANAYGWGDLFKEKASPTALPEWIDGAEDEILARLFRLNQERAEAEA